VLVIPAAASCVAQWPFNEASGNAQDVSPNANLLTMTGATVGSGRYGNARVFSGTGQYGDAGNGASLTSFGTGAIGILAWVFVNAAPGSAFPAMIEKGTGDWSAASGTQKGFYLSVGYNAAGEKVHWVVGDGTGYDVVEDTIDTLIGTWTHIAAVAEPVGGSPLLRLYLNGTQTQTVARAKTGAIDDTTDALNVGRWRQFTRYLNGTIDSLYLCNHTLRVEEITAHRLLRPRKR